MLKKLVSLLVVAFSTCSFLIANVSAAICPPHYTTLHSEIIGVSGATSHVYISEYRDGVPIYSYCTVVTFNVQNEYICKYCNEVTYSYVSQAPVHQDCGE